MASPSRRVSVTPTRGGAREGGGGKLSMSISRRLSLSPSIEDTMTIVRIVHPWKRNNQLLTFDASDTAIQAWGEDLSCGCRVMITTGSWQGIVSTIIGVRDGFLWRHDDGERGAGAFNAYTKAELGERYALKAIGRVVLQGIETLTVERSETPDNLSIVSPIKAANTSTTDTSHPQATAGGNFGAILSQPKEGFFYCGPVSRAMEDSSDFVPQVVEYDVASQTLQRFRFQARQRVLFTAGPRRGRVANIIGVYNGRLVRQEENDWPRMFDNRDPIAQSKPVVIQREVHIEPYPQSFFRFHRSRYDTDAADLVKGWGVLYGTRFQHLLGSHKGSVSVVLGLLDDTLYALRDEDHLVSFSSIQELASSGPKLMGYQSTPMELPPVHLLYPFPTKVPGVEDPAMQMFDIRTTTCLTFHRQHGQAVKVTSGPRTGDVGRVVGVSVEDGLQYVVFDVHEGAIPAESAGTMTLLSRQSQSLFVDDEVPSRLPGAYTFQVAQSTGERIKLDARTMACSLFHLFSGQQVVYRRSSEVDAFTDPLAGSWNDQNADGTHHEFVPPTDWSVGTVVGVYRHELWIQNPRTKLVSPLDGKNSSEIRRNYRIAVYGLLPSFDVNSGFPNHYDPFLPVVASASSGAAGGGGGLQAGSDRAGSAMTSYTVATHHNPALQELSTVMCFPTPEGRRCFDISVEGLQQRCKDITFATLTSNSSTTPSAGQTVISPGTRLRRSTRIQPRIKHSKKKKSTVTHSAAGDVQPTEWELFSEPVWCSVLGVLKDQLYVVFDAEPKVAVPISDNDLRLSAVVAPEDPGFVAGPKLEADLSDPKWRLQDEGRSSAEDALAAAVQRIQRSTQTIRLMDGKSVAAAEGAISDTRVKEMRHAFCLLPHNHIMDILQWVLGQFGLHLSDGDTACDGYRKLATIEDCFDQPVPIPSVLDWHARQRAILGETEDSIRELSYIDEREGRAELLFQMRVEHYRVSFLHDAQHNHDHDEEHNTSMFEVPDGFDASNAAGGGGGPDDTPTSSATKKKLRRSTHAGRSSVPEGLKSPEKKFLETRSTRFKEWRRTVKNVSSYFDHQVFFPDAKAQEKAMRRKQEAEKERLAAEAAEAEEQQSLELGTSVCNASPLALSSSATASFRGSTSLGVSSSATRVKKNYSKCLPVHAKALLPQVFRPLVTAAPHWPMKYILQNGKTVFFDISAESCRPFGMYHGEQYTVLKGDLAGKKITILGVYGKRLWRYFDDTEAMPFMEGTPDEVRRRHGLEKVEKRDMTGKVRLADPFFFHTTHGELAEFNVGDDALDPYGVRFGERYLVTADDVSLALPRTPLVVIGEREGHLWFAQQWDGARPFAGSDFKKSLGLKPLYTADLFTWLQDMDERKGEGNTVQRRCITHPISHNVIHCFDVTRQTCEPFGVYPGQHVHHTKGPLQPQQGTIVGVHLGKLYRVISGEKGATAYEGDPDRFMELHTLTVSKWTRPALAGDIDTEGCAAYRERQKRFRMMTTASEIYLFDVRPDVVASVFRFKPGDKVVFRKQGKYFGRTAVIVGRRGDALWKIDEGELNASLFLGCRHYRDLEAEYKPEYMSSLNLKEHVG